MERTRSRARRALWIILPAVAAAALAIPRALAWGHHHPAPSSSAELAEHLEDKLDHLLDRIDASDAQRTRASEIAERRAPELFALMGEGRAVRQKLKAALLAERLDQAQLGALRSELTTLADRASAVGLDSAFELAAVLTPEQRKQVAERLARFER